MKGFPILLVALLLIVAVAVGAPVARSEQTPSQSSAGDLSNWDVPFIVVELSDSLNAKKLKPGDKVKAQVSQDVLAHGRVLIPAESKLLGHVTEANGRSENEESRLGLVFDKILLKHHEELNMRGVVRTVAPPVVKRSRMDEPDPMMPPGTPGNPSSTISPLGSNTGRRGQNSGTGAANRPNPPTTPGIIPPDAQIGSTLPGTPGYKPPDLAANTSAQNRSLSVGMRQGVFGLKGLSLSTETSSLTPGPVIVSKVADVKLESGTQMLLKILDSSANHP